MKSGDRGDAVDSDFSELQFFLHEKVFHGFADHVLFCILFSSYLFLNSIVLVFYLLCMIKLKVLIEMLRDVISHIYS